MIKEGYEKKKFHDKERKKKVKVGGKHAEGEYFVITCVLFLLSQILFKVIILFNESKKY